jgi:hypothetical protein
MEYCSDGVIDFGDRTRNLLMERESSTPILQHSITPINTVTLLLTKTEVGALRPGSPPPRM